MDSPELFRGKGGISKPLSEFSNKELKRKVGSVQRKAHAAFIQQCQQDDIFEALEAEMESRSIPVLEYNGPTWEEVKASRAEES